MFQFMPAKGKPFAGRRMRRSGMFRIGMIGAGINASPHVEAIDAREDCALSAVCDIVPGRAGSYAKPRGARVYTSWELMIAECPMDGAIINLPHGLHEDCAVACARRGLHILLEKPMSVSVESCDRILESADRAGVTLFIGHVQQYEANYRHAREIIASGELGRLISMRDIRSGNYFLDGRPHWFLDPALSGGGIGINLGAHTVNRLLYLSGSSITAVHGKAMRDLPAWQVESGLSAFFEFASGAVATATLVATDVPVHNGTECYLERGALYLSFIDLRIARGNGQSEVVRLDRADPMGLQLDDFIAAARGKRPIAIPGAFGREVIRVITEVYRQSGLYGHG